MGSAPRDGLGRHADLAREIPRRVDDRVERPGGDEGERGGIGAIAGDPRDAGEHEGIGEPPTDERNVVVPREADFDRVPPDEPCPAEEKDAHVDTLPAPRAAQALPHLREGAAVTAASPRRGVSAHPFGLREGFEHPCRVPSDAGVGASGKLSELVAKVARVEVACEAVDELAEARRNERAGCAAWPRDERTPRSYFFGLAFAAASSASRSL